MKHNHEKTAHNIFGIILAVIAVPVVIALVVVWVTTGIGGKLADVIARRRRNEEAPENNN